jgi:hypothetical protein
MSEGRWDTVDDEMVEGADPLAEGFEDEEPPPASELEAEEELLEDEDGPPPT